MSASRPEPAMIRFCPSPCSIASRATRLAGWSSTRRMLTRAAVGPSGGRASRGSAATDASTPPRSSPAVGDARPPIADRPTARPADRARPARPSPVQPYAQQRQQLIHVDRLGDVVDAPASMHFSRSPFMALAVTAMIGNCRNSASPGWPASSRSRPSPASSRPSARHRFRASPAAADAVAPALRVRPP